MGDATKREPIAKVDIAMGKYHLDVNGVVVCMEGDPNRWWGPDNAWFPTAGHSVWTKESLQVAADQINAKHNKPDPLVGASELETRSDDIIKQVLRRFESRRAKVLDEACAEACTAYSCKPEDLEIRVRLEGAVEVVEVMGPRPSFREIRFDFTPRIRDE